MKNQFDVEQKRFIGLIDSYSAFGETFYRYDYQDSERGGLIVVSSSKGIGWDEVSIDIDTPSERCPFFEEMAMFKDIFWDEAEVVMQVHPAQSRYVNIHPFTLHLWRNNRLSRRRENKLRSRIIDAYKNAEQILPNPGVMLYQTRREKMVIINSGSETKPTWDEMCKIKREFWGQEEEAVQFNLGVNFDCSTYYTILWDAREFKLP